MLKERLKKYKIVLASGSPRRQQFFRDLDLDFEVRLPDVEETYPDHLVRQEITDYLALLKAEAFDTVADDEIIITSDTIVWHNGKALGKPVDFDDAVSILKSLSDATHEVVTSVCFRSKDKTDVIHEVTRVTFHPLTDDEIRFYVEEFKPFDKAGAYGIQDWIGLVGVARIEGSYANVMGMPVDKVFHYLKAFCHD